MAYQAIYRRWRPRVFDDVIGQEHITKTLKNELINGKTAHAYLFCGTRGTGKTSTAKILAKAVNCLNPKDGSPCCECEICRGIDDESIMDVVELDAASRTGVDDIRSVIEEAMFSPTAAKKKVYIIDEVHMISVNAFNALLKTLEEPPEHVMFILATTELHKIPATILSRCQRFDFRRIKNSDIVARIKTIIESDGYSAADDALELIAELGDGSMRDALSVLDQCLSFKAEGLTYDDVLGIIGIADDTALYGICDAILDGDGGRAVSTLDEVVTNGKDLGVFFERLVKLLRDIMIVRLAKSAGNILTVSEEKLERLKAYAQRFTAEKLTNSLRLLNDGYVKAKSSSFSRTIYELCIIKMCNPQIDDSPEAMADRLAELEDKLKNGSFALPPKAEEPREETETDAPFDIPEPATAVPEPVAAAPAPPPKAEEAPAAEENTEYKGNIDPAAKWKQILAEVRARGGAPSYPHLVRVEAKLHNGRFVLVFDNDAGLSKEIVSKPRNIEIIEAAVEAVCAEKLSVACFFKKEMGYGETKENPLEKLEELGKRHSVFEVVD